MEKLSANTNALNWFEIPMVDVERAKKFYETVFDVALTPMDMNGDQMLMFPYAPEANKVSGSLVKGEFHKPGMQGPIVYMNANPSINAVASKIETAGGNMLLPPMQVSPEVGWIALFADSEGNQMGLHANGE